MFSFMKKDAPIVHTTKASFVSKISYRLISFPDAEAILFLKV